MYPLVHSNDFWHLNEKETPLPQKLTREIDFNQLEFEY